jgi:NADPH:quinone reductase-like Zn-dependent oxidoreductase
MDLAGTVEAVGENVSKFKPGDEVIGLPGSGFGCHAEYTCMSQDDPITLKPKNLTFEQAVTLVFGGTTAVEFLSRVAIGKGSEVLVNGASGASGSAAVQLAKIVGATVTGVQSWQCGACEITRRGSHHLLHQRGFCRERKSL